MTTVDNKANKKTFESHYIQQATNLVRSENVIRQTGGIHIII